jgi:osmotically-inducible protein OsmY
MAGATTRDDEQIQQEVLDEMKWEARVQPNEIGVSVADGIVTLTGWVDSYAKKWAAEEGAHRVRSVVAVANDIEVRLPSSAERGDPDIATAAVRALEWDAFVPIQEIDVTVSRGWVTLAGQVEWDFQRRAAERAVRRLAGVRGVSNLITVRPRQEPSAAELRGRIEEALIRTARTDAERITVDIDGGKVVLEGTVHSWPEREAAERLAWSAPGVTAVENRVSVAPS